MRTSGKTWGRVCLGMASAALILHGSTAAEAESQQTPSTERGGPTAFIRIDQPQTVLAVRWAIDGAHEWLGNPGCQQVFSDFRDLSGRLLSDVLAERGESGQSHLGRLFFYDGSQQGVCAGRGAAAMTQPGSHVVFVCSAGFREIAREPRKARVIVIHELLHTLGLGENPPSGREITARVQERCWE